MANILVAEDELAVRELVSRALQLDGHVVAAVEDGAEALALLKNTKTSFDLLLADIVMPAMDGIALAQHVKSLFPDMPIVLMTGYPSERHRALNLHVGIREVVSKPFTIENLRGAVTAALAC